MPSNFFSPFDLLNEDPRMAYFSFQNQFGRSPKQREFFEGFFPQAQDEFSGVLGQRLRQGNLDPFQFTDFLGNFDFNDRFQSLPPSMRGGLSGRFSPPTEFFFRR